MNNGRSAHNNDSMMQRRSIPLGACVLAGVLATAMGAARGQSTGHLADLTLEQLSSIEVTSVGKRVQRLADVPGSVFIISQEDIRRSGAITLPEVLRLAPNLQVARADAHQYAITARGFNSVLANKMLVLVDGRTAYSPLFSGVFWEVQDLLVDDIERIEVLSGAGGTLYGSNAINGVINIISRNAAETTGTLLKGAWGSAERVAAARYGAGSPEGLNWRLYAKRVLTDHTELTSGAPVRDAGNRTVAGFRADSARGKDQLTVQGDIYQSRIDQSGGARELGGANLLARWSRDDGAGSRTQLQTYFDRAERDQPGVLNDTLDTWDIEFQRASRPRPGHELLWGAGYRWMSDQAENIAPAVLRLQPAHRKLHLWNLFAQDEVVLAPAWRFTVGLKAEHNSYTGLEWLPNLRLAWQPAPDQLAWVAASRAVRTPARVDREVFTPQLNLGGSSFDSEVAQVFEAGFRSQPATGLSYSLTLFHHDFERLRSLDLSPAGLAFGNSIHGHLNGFEGWGRWRVNDRWRLQAGYVHQKFSLAANAGAATVPAGIAQLGNDPRSRGQLGVAWDFAANMELDLRARYMGALPSPAVPSYTAVDVRWGWRVRPDLELSLAIRNLTDRRHPEWGNPANRAEIERSVLLKAIWRL